MVNNHRPHVPSWVCFGSLHDNLHMGMCHPWIILCLMLLTYFVQQGIESRNGQIELCFYVIRGILNVFFVICVQNLLSQWKSEKQVYLVDCRVWFSLSTMHDLIIRWWNWWCEFQWVYPRWFDLMLDSSEVLLIMIHPENDRVCFKSWYK